MGEITTAHIAILIGLVGLFSPIATGIAILFLQRLFGTGDKAAADQKALEQRITKLESEHDLHESEKELLRLRVMQHVGEGFATKPQFDALAKKLDDSLGRLERMVVPIFKRLYPDAAVPE